MSTTGHEPDQITGVVLAGGMGRRMDGIDKGLVKLNGREMISYVIDALQPHVLNVVVNANRNIDAYQKFGASVVADSIEGYQGPLAGVEAGLAQAETPWIFTCPCDSPIQSPQLLPFMWQQIKNTDANIGMAHDGERTHPVFSLVHTSLLDSLRAYLAAGDRKIDRWFEQQKLLTIDCSDYAESFVNINTKEELDSAELQLFPGNANGN